MIIKSHRGIFLFHIAIKPVNYNFTVIKSLVVNLIPKRFMTLLKTFHLQIKNQRTSFGDENFLHFTYVYHQK